MQKMKKCIVSLHYTLYRNVYKYYLDREMKAEVMVFNTVSCVL